MVTTRQRQAFKTKLKLVQENKPVYLRRVMKDVGYSPSACRTPKVLTESLGWQELQSKYADDEKALLTLNELADGENQDKDNRLRASIEILKLNDRYPANKSKIIGMFDKISALEEDEI
jgi:hypothetical protein